MKIEIKKDQRKWMSTSHPQDTDQKIEILYDMTSFVNEAFFIYQK